MQKLTNDEQGKLIKLHLIIPFALDALELDAKAIEPMSFGHIYVTYIRSLQDQLSKLLYATNNALRRHGIKVHLIEQGKEFGIVAEYWMRGYHFSYSLIPRFIRAEIERLLVELMEGK